MFQIKICGITSVDDALAVARAGADAIGLNFYPRSPRYIALDTAREIVAALPKEIVKVGLFVNAPPADVCRTYDDLQLDLIQLHGDEPPEYMAELGNRPVMRAFRVEQGNLRPVIKYLDRCSELRHLPGLVMLDALVLGEYGGTGKAADWSTAREYVAQESAHFLECGDESPHSKKPQTRTDSHVGLPPLVLAGGLTPGNVAEAIAAVRPAAVDVASGVESSPGRKDAEAVEAFVRAARAAFG